MRFYAAVTFFYLFIFYFILFFFFLLFTFWEKFVPPHFSAPSYATEYVIYSMILQGHDVFVTSDTGVALTKMVNMFDLNRSPYS